MCWAIPKQFAFVRGNLGQADTSLWIANADGAEERKLATRKDPERFDYGVGIGPAWSPDGKVIACSVGSVDAVGDYHTVVGVGVEGGEQKSITPQRWSEGGQLAWRSDGSGLVLVGDSKVWQISYPEGIARKVTNDANSYVGISLAAGSNTLAISRFQRFKAELPSPGLIAQAVTFRAFGTGKREF